MNNQIRKVVQKNYIYGIFVTDYILEPEYIGYLYDVSSLTQSVSADEELEAIRIYKKRQSIETKKLVGKYNMLEQQVKNKQKVRNAVRNN